METVVVNQRNFIRAKIALKLCGYHYEENPDNTRSYKDCFMCGTTDMSEGGMQILHNGQLNKGDIVELRTKNAITLSRCLKCDQYYNMRSKVELQPLTVRVIWCAGQRAGLEFINLSSYNKNMISKLVWQKHIEEVKKRKDKKKQ